MSTSSAHADSERGLLWLIEQEEEWKRPSRRESRDGKHKDEPEEPAGTKGAETEKWIAQNIWTRLWPTVVKKHPSADEDEQKHKTCIETFSIDTAAVHQVRGRDLIRDLLREVPGTVLLKRRPAEMWVYLNNEH